MFALTTQHLCVNDWNTRQRSFLGTPRVLINFDYAVFEFISFKFTVILFGLIIDRFMICDWRL